MNKGSLFVVLFGIGVVCISAAFVIGIREVYRISNESIADSNRRIEATKK